MILILQFCVFCLLARLKYYLNYVGLFTSPSLLVLGSVNINQMWLIWLITYVSSNFGQIFRGEISLYLSCSHHYIYIVIYTEFDVTFLSEIALNLISIPLSTVDKLNRANAQKWLIPAQWLVVQWLVANAVAEWLSVQWLDAVSSKWPDKFST